ATTIISRPAKTERAIAFSSTPRAASSRKSSSGERRSLPVPAGPVLDLELRPIAREEFAQLLAPGLRRGQHFRFVAEVVGPLVAGREIVPPEPVGDLARPEAVDAESLQRTAAGAQRRLECLALDEGYAARSESDVVRDVARPRDDRKTRKVLADDVRQ